MDKELRRSFGLWLNRLFEKRRIPVSIDIEKLSSSEVRTLLETNLRRFEEETLTKGRQEGEQQKAREVAKKLKESGIDAAIIAESTGLSIEELKLL